MCLRVLFYINMDIWYYSIAITADFLRHNFQLDTYPLQFHFNKIIVCRVFGSFFLPNHFFLFHHSKNENRRSIFTDTMSMKAYKYETRFNISLETLSSCNQKKRCIKMEKEKSSKLNSFAYYVFLVFYPMWYRWRFCNIFSLFLVFFPPSFSLFLSTFEGWITYSTGHELRAIPTFFIAARWRSEHV